MRVRTHEYSVRFHETRPSSSLDNDVEIKVHKDL